MLWNFIKNIVLRNKYQYQKSSDNIEIKEEEEKVENQDINEKNNRSNSSSKFDRYLFLTAGSNNEDVSHFISNFEFIKSVKYGELYRNPNDQQYWFKSEADNTFYRVDNGCVVFFLKWMDQTLPMIEEQIEAIAKIGGTERDVYGNDKGNIKVPCKITRCDGTVLDPAIIYIAKQAPLSSWQNIKLLGSKSDQIEPSDFALPLEIRVEMVKAKEMRMGFCPTRVITPDDEKYILLGRKHVYNYKGVPGKDMRLPDEVFYEGDATVIRGDEFEKEADIHYVYFDWFDGCLSIVPEEVHEEQFEIF